MKRFLLVSLTIWHKMTRTPDNKKIINNSAATIRPKGMSRRDSYGTPNLRGIFWPTYRLLLLSSNSKSNKEMD